jgi:hypothetical protein
MSVVPWLPIAAADQKRKVKPGQGDHGDTAGGIMQAVKRALDY